METRIGWRRGLRLTKGQALAIRNTRRVAQRRRDDEFDRRLRAILLVGERSLTQAEAARVFEVSENCVTRWVMAYERSGVEGLRPGKHTGAPRRLSNRQRDRLAKLVRAGPEAYGLDTGVWTAPMVGKVIANEFSVKYSAGQVRRILHELRFSLQYPKRVLSEAQFAEQRKWISREYPRIKKKRETREA